MGKRNTKRAVKRKLVTKGIESRKKQNSSCSDHDTVEMFKLLYEDLFENARYERINPFACIRIVNIRPINAGGVMRLISLFSKGYKHVDDICPTGLAFGTDTPLVVELTGDLKFLLVDHFKEQGKSDDEIEEAISTHDSWYGIIDGAHSNEAIKKLCNDKPEWKGFKWLVTVLRGGYSLDRYRQLARAQNSRHSPRFYVELTFFDEINNLRLEYDYLVRCQSKPSQIQVARSYFGTEDVSNTRKFLASMAVRLPKRVINELGNIMNKEMPEECLRHDNFDSCGATTVDGLLSATDCRIFTKFVTLHSLRMSTVFMNASSDTEVEAQCNTLHRAKEHFLLNGLKTIQYQLINHQFKMAMSALDEEKKFLKYLGSTEWPSQMISIRRNLLRSTVMDDEIESNKGNEHTVLTTLRQSLMAVSPNLVKTCDERLKQSIEEISSPDTDSNSNQQTETEQFSTNDSLPSPSDDQEPETPIPDPEEIKKKKLEDTLGNLRTNGIDCVNMDWRAFLRTSWNSDSGRADTIITEPPPITSRTFLGFDVQSRQKYVEEELSKEEVSEMPNLAKRLLKPGGYVILILKFEAYGEWFESFRKEGYIIMPYPYVFGYKPESIQDRNPTHVPQSGADFALIAYLPSENQFLPDFKAVFSALGSKHRRNVAIMTDIPAPKSKLCRPGTRSPFITSEKSVLMLMEAIDLFTPSAGFTIDLYGGTMTTALAAQMKGRRCLCFEKKADLFLAAVERLLMCLPQSTVSGGKSTPNKDTLCSDPQGIPPADLDLGVIEEEAEDQIDVTDGISEQNDPSSDTVIGTSKPMQVSHITTNNKMVPNSNDTSSLRNDISHNSQNCQNPLPSKDSAHANNNGLQTLAEAAEKEKNIVSRIGIKRVRCMVKPFLKRMVL